MAIHGFVGHTRLPEPSSPPSFAAVYDAYFREVIGWMQAMNVPSTDREDAAQKLFLRRETLLLFEVEGYSGHEMATLHGVPIRTVWTRLYHARKELLSLVAARRKRR